MLCYPSYPHLLAVVLATIAAAAVEVRVVVLATIAAAASAAAAVEVCVVVLATIAAAVVVVS